MARFELQFAHGSGEIVVLDGVLQQLRLQIVVSRIRYLDADGLSLLRVVLQRNMPSVSGRTEIEDFRDERWTPSNEPASGRCPRAADERFRLSNHLTPRYFTHPITSTPAMSVAYASISGLNTA